MANYEDNLIRAIRAGDETQIQKEYKNLCDSMAAQHQNPPQPLDSWRRIYAAR